MTSRSRIPASSCRSSASAPRSAFRPPRGAAEALRGGDRCPGGRRRQTDRHSLGVRQRRKRDRRHRRGEQACASACSSQPRSRSARAKAGADEFQRSLQRLAPTRSICCSFTTYRSAHQSLSQLRDWKAAGRCRYIGVTSTYPRTTARWKRSSAGRSRISSRSTIRWTIAAPKSASFPPRQRRAPRC